VTISELPDDVLLEIFSFYLDYQRDNEDAWHALVHVCRRWRCLVFASPRHLHLRLLCTDKSPVKEALDVWPEFPIAIRALYYGRLRSRIQALVTNVIAALEQHGRVCEIRLEGDPDWLLKIFSAMKKPFPSLVNLKITSNEIPWQASMIPDSFLGGSAPRLQSLELYWIPCPEIGKLLLSARNLVFLRLDGIPRSGQRYTSPEAMVSDLSMLTGLKSLRLTFVMITPRSQSLQASGHPLPFARVVLPTLADIYFYGDKEYLEDFVSRIDTPLLTNITIGFINLWVSVTPPLRDFISRTETFGAYSRIETYFSGDRAKIEFFRRGGEGV